ncbi:MAG: methylaspartate ammonia-lyase [Clostridia bacterium]
MVKIEKIICSAGKTGFFFDDQKAIKLGAKADGAAYIGNPVTNGFTAIRQSGESISVMIVLSDGQVAYGDCAAVQYSGAGGRDPLFLAADYIPVIENQIAPKYIGKELNSFKELANIVDNMQDDRLGKRMHTAIRYGVTQALLDAVAKAKHKLMAEIVAEEWHTNGISENEIRIFTQSGDNRYENVDKMIIKSAPTLPHGLINNVHTKLGENGEILLDYVRWLKNRIMQLRIDDSYLPNLHIDVYGTIGLAFDNDEEKIINYFEKLSKAAAPFNLYIEGPVDMGERQAQINMLSKLCAMNRERHIKIKIVADEWCNTYNDVVDFSNAKAGDMIQIKTPDLGGVNNIIEAVLYCKKVGIEAYQGGTCNETNRSAEICTNIAMAVKPDLILAKPGMGVDEGFMIVNNEMHRILAYMKAKRS